MTKRAPLVVYDYPILKPLRHDGRWWKVEDKTIRLAPRQTPFLLRSGKIGPRVTTAVKVATTQTKKEVKNG